MNIQNYSSTLNEEDFKEVCGYLEDIVSVSENDKNVPEIFRAKGSYNPLRDSHGLYALTQQIPIYIIDKPDPNTDYVESRGEGGGPGMYIDTLGIYVYENIGYSYVNVHCKKVSAKSNFGAPEGAMVLLTADMVSEIMNDSKSKPEHNPENDEVRIVLFADVIAKATSNEQERNWLYAKVLLHEFMHALMDTRRNGRVKCKSKVDGMFGYYSEELLANALTACYISAINKPELLDYALAYMDSQAEPYKLGAKYYREFGEYNVQRIAGKYVEQKRNGYPKEYKHDWMRGINTGREMLDLECVRGKGGYIRYRKKYYCALNEYSEWSGLFVAQLLRDWVDKQRGNVTKEELVEVFPKALQPYREPLGLRHCMFTKWQSSSLKTGCDDFSVTLSDETVHVARHWKKEEVLEFIKLFRSQVKSYRYAVEVVEDYDHEYY